MGGTRNCKQQITRLPRFRPGDVIDYGGVAGVIEELVGILGRDDEIVVWHAQVRGWEEPYPVRDMRLADAACIEEWIGLGLDADDPDVIAALQTAPKDETKSADPPSFEEPAMLASPQSRIRDEIAVALREWGINYPHEKMPNPWPFGMVGKLATRLGMRPGTLSSRLGAMRTYYYKVDAKRYDQEPC